MTKKITVGILFGGNSVEHKISLLSAKNIIEAIDHDKFNVVLIGIDEQGNWMYHADANNYLLESHDPTLIRLTNATTAVAILPGNESQQLTAVSQGQITNEKIDVIFPVLHGPNGEDGTIQGLLRLAGIPFVGSDVASTAVCMDKDLCKRLLRDAGIPNANFLTLRAHERNHYQFEDLVNIVGLPFFIKPANSGSSVGITRVKSKEQFRACLDNAFLYDDKVIIEQSISGREIETAVLGNDDPVVAKPGELLIHNHEFYSYQAKYIDEQGATAVVPADLPAQTIQDIQDMAIKTFKVLNCSGLARIDFFLTDAGEPLINEVNTLPGFTNISMYPKMWQASGLSYPDLIEKLIMLALERGEARKKLLTRYKAQSDIAASV